MQIQRGFLLVSTLEYLLNTSSMSLCSVDSIEFLHFQFIPVQYVSFLFVSKFEETYELGCFLALHRKLTERPSMQFFYCA